MRIKVTGKIILEPLPTSGGFWHRLWTPKMWQLHAPITIDFGDVYITLKEGETTDGASVPRFAKALFPDDALYGFAGITHDQLYKTGELGKWLADACFFELLRRVDDMPWFTASVMWIGVWIGGWPAWMRYRRREKLGARYPVPSVTRDDIDDQ